MTDTTIIIPTSPVLSNPSTTKIDLTIESIRRHMPDAPIVITCDGPVNPAYSTFVTKLHSRYDNSTIVPFAEHVHQSGMLSVALALSLTPFIFYLEHDWAILPSIEWEPIKAAIAAGEFNYVKLYQGDRIHPLHEHLMEDRGSVNGAYFIRTRQWSQNPHLASTEFYRKKVLPHCEGKVDFIENIMHGMVGNSPWVNYRCAIYNPVENGMQRVRHLDGRAL